MKAFAYLFFATILFTSCKTRTSNNSNQGIPIDSAQKVFMDIVVAKPVFVCSFKDSANRDFIVGINEYKNSNLNSDKNYILTRIASVNNNWQIEKEDTIGYKQQVNILLDSFKVENLNNQNLISFTTEHFGGPGDFEIYKTIDFHLIDVITFHDYSIICDGEDVYDSSEPVVSGDFSYDNLLNKNPVLKKFQEIKSQQSKYIYKKTAADYDINNVINYNKKWLIDNPGIQDTKYADNDSIRFTYYDRGLIDDYLNIDTTDDGSEIIQNDNYKIIAMMRNGVYAYDKKLKKQFLVWPQDHNTYENFDVEFQGKDIVSITSNSDYNVTVDLDKKTYSRKPLNTKMNYNIDQNDSAAATTPR